MKEVVNNNQFLFNQQIDEGLNTVGIVGMIMTIGYILYLLFCR